MENIHGLLYAIINLQMKSETAGSLPLATLYHIGKFTEYSTYIATSRLFSDHLCRTLHKIHTYVEAAQEGNRLKHFFRQSEMNTLFKGCRAGLQEALEEFIVSLVV